MRTFGALIGRAALLALLAGLAACGVPYLQHGVKVARLLAEEPPVWLPVPVAGVAAAALGDSWGDPRGGGRAHEGIDIFARRGTPVASATHGIVTFRGTLGLGGRVVTVLGPGGYRHYYAHLDAWATPRQGDWVEAGEVIGYVGATGNAAGGPQHLHYGIYAPGGGAINPLPLLRAPPPVVPVEPAPAPVAAGS